jgi:hypothetical protein
MKKMYVSLLVLILAALAVSTLYGETLYALGKPVVTVRSATGRLNDPLTYVPLEALRRDGDGDYVYALLSEQGYSRRIYTVIRASVVIHTPDTGLGTAGLSSGYIILDRVVVQTDRELTDGCRVVLK